MPQHVLLITCTSGNGHLVAMNNICDEIISQNPDTVFHTLDTVQYMYPFRKLTVAWWNRGMRRDSFLTHFSSTTAYISEFMHRHFFGKKLSTDIRALIHSFPIQTIIDTQPLFTSSMLAQIAVTSRLPITYHKVLTDLPVNEDHPCFPGIKRCKQYQNIDFYVHALSPLAGTQEEVSAFWKTHCHLDTNHIKAIWSKPVHSAFKIVPKNLNHVRVGIHPDLMVHYGFVMNPNLVLPDNANVTTLMMGSQGLDAIEAYFDKIMAQFVGKKLNAPHYFFIACSRNEALFKKLLNKSLQMIPKNSEAKIIPLEMQSLENVASLMWRSQTILLRGSGLSCIEQLAMDEAAKNAGVMFKPKRFIHSHCKKSIPVDFLPAEQSQFLLKHSVGHEKANTIYMQEKLNAMLTRADLIELEG